MTKQEDTIAEIVEDIEFDTDRWIELIKRSDLVSSATSTREYRVDNKIIIRSEIIVERVI